MKEIKLSQRGKNKGKYVALVDDEDFENINSFKWYADKHGNTFYAARKIRFNGIQKSIFMHWDVIGGKFIDHIDHDGLNNQKSNLRPCTRSENQMNRQKQANTSSIYKGVYFYKPTGKWRATVIINGKQIYLGYFASETDAAKAYNLKAIELFCEFANLNNIK